MHFETENRLNMKIKNLLFTLTAGLILVACVNTQQAKKKEKPANVVKVPAQTIIYKTKANFNNLVPVGLSENKKEVVSLPAPTDLLNGNNLRTPIQLHNGYLLDQRGIGPNTAFIKTTYQEYSKRNQPMSSPEILNNIKEADPIVEMYSCKYKGSSGELVDWLNDLIDKGQLSTKCTKLK